MHNQTYLMRRGAVYYTRVRIPNDLMTLLEPRSEIRVSLRTKNRAEAIRRSHDIVTQITAYFDKLRRSRTPEAAQ